MIPTPPFESGDTAASSMDFVSGLYWEYRIAPLFFILNESFPWLNFPKDSLTISLMYSVCIIQYETCFV